MGQAIWLQLHFNHFSFVLTASWLALSPTATPDIVPLLAAALMQNQVESLKSKGVAAEYLSSTKTEAERRGTLMQLQTTPPSIKLLFVTPELLATDR